MFRCILKNIALFGYLFAFSSFSLTQPATAAPKPVLIRITLQEAQIIQQILSQIELASQEVEPYLAIVKPLEQLLATTTVTEAEKATKNVVLRLPLEATHNMLLFLQRATIPALGAKQLDKIVKKVEKNLPKDSDASPSPSKKPNLVTLHLTQIEARLVQHLLEQIDITISEVEPFLAIYLPLEQESANVRDTSKDVILKLPEIAPRNLLLFLERTRIIGQQAKVIYGIIEKLQQLTNTIASAPNKDK